MSCCCMELLSLASPSPLFLPLLSALRFSSEDYGKGPNATTDRSPGCAAVNVSCSLPITPELPTSRGAQTPLPGWEPLCGGHASFHREATTAPWPAAAPSRALGRTIPAARGDLPADSHSQGPSAQERGQVPGGHHPGPSSRCPAGRWLGPCSRGPGAGACLTLVGPQSSSAEPQLCSEAGPSLLQASVGGCVYVAVNVSQRRTLRHAWGW